MRLNKMVSMCAHIHKPSWMLKAFWEGSLSLCPTHCERCFMSLITTAQGKALWKHLIRFQSLARMSQNGNTTRLDCHLLNQLPRFFLSNLDCVADIIKLKNRSLFESLLLITSIVFVPQIQHANSY